MGKLKLFLIIVGGFVMLRFIGQLLRAKRNVAEQSRMKQQQEALQKQREYIARNEGKVNVFGRQAKPSGPYEDVDYEEVKK